MSNLRDIRLPLTQLTKLEQLNIHEAIRVSRKVSKVRETKKRVAKARNTNKINKAVSNLTTEQAQAILEALKREGKI